MHKEKKRNIGERKRGGKIKKETPPIALFLEYKGGGKRREKKCPASRNDEKRRGNTTGGKKEILSVCPVLRREKGGREKVQEAKLLLLRSSC